MFLISFAYIFATHRWTVFGETLWLSEMSDGETEGRCFEIVNWTYEREIFLIFQQEPDHIVRAMHLIQTTLNCLAVLTSLSQVSSPTIPSSPGRTAQILSNYTNQYLLWIPVIWNDPLLHFRLPATTQLYTNARWRSTLLRYHRWITWQWTHQISLDHASYQVRRPSKKPHKYLHTVLTISHISVCRYTKHSHQIKET